MWTIRIILAANPNQEAEKISRQTKPAKSYAAKLPLPGRLGRVYLWAVISPEHGQRPMLISYFDSQN